MRKTNLFIGLAVIVLVVMITLVFNSCKKDSNSNADEESAIEASSDVQLTDNVDNAIDNIDNSLDGFFSTNKTMSDLTDDCTSISASGAIYPRTFTLNYGTACTKNGVTFGGTVKVTYSATRWALGFVKTVEFVDFYINGNKVNGKKTVTFIGNLSNVSFTEVHDFSIVTSVGTITTSGTRTFTRTDGGLSPLNVLDDVYSVTGENTGTSAKGVTFTTKVDLKRLVGCRFPISGTRTITTPKKIVVIDYGTGDCDTKATRTVNGKVAVEITLK